MFSEFKISNFRCFKDITLPLAHFNIITGKNNVGKTSLLEALFLHLGFANPNLTFHINVFRGVFPTIDPEITWGWLFRDCKFEDEIVFESKHNSDVIRTIITTESFQEQHLSDSYKLYENTKFSGGEKPSLVGVKWDRLLKFKVVKNESLIQDTHSFFTEAGPTLNSTSKHPNPFSSGIFLSTSSRNPIETLDRFSKLITEKKEEELLKTLRMFEPDLKEVSILTSKGSPVLKADIGLENLIPLSLLGEGFLHMFNLYLAIADAPGGIVLIDEIENGIHHSIQKDYWCALFRMASNSNTQIVATTHSMECLEAAHEAFLSEENLFGDKNLEIHRLEKHGDEIKVINYDSETFTAALEMNLELR